MVDYHKNEKQISITDSTGNPYYFNQEEKPLLDSKGRFYVMACGDYEYPNYWLVEYNNTTFFVKDKLVIVKDAIDLFILGDFDGNDVFTFQKADETYVSVKNKEIYQHVGKLVREAIKAKGTNSLGDWTIEIDKDCFVVARENIYIPSVNPTKSSTVIRQADQIIKISSTYNIKDNEIKEVDSDSLRVEFATGAQRSAAVEKYRYDLIHPIFAKTLAEVLAEGAAKYGDHNWELGFPISDLFNHLLAHAFDYLSGDRSEDHLGHLACNAMFLVVESRMREKEHASELRLKDCILSPEMIETIKKSQKARKLPPRRKDWNELTTLEESNTFESEPSIDWNLQYDIDIRLLKLYTSGVLKYYAGASLPLKYLGKTHFNDIAFSTLRKCLEKHEIFPDINDNLPNLDLKV